jgi:hypothetical protein
VTKLAAITIRSASSVYDVRKKIHGLAGALGYDDVSSIRLATATSQVCRVLATGDASARIEVGLRIVNDRPALVLSFLGRVSLNVDGWLATFFDSIEPVHGQGMAEENKGVYAIKWLPTNAHPLSPERLESERQRLQQRSREELMQEIRAQK